MSTRFIRLEIFIYDYSRDAIPAVTALNFDDNLTYGVGMSSGQVLLFDVRMSRPFKIKDHLNELAIKDVVFLGENVLSLDESILKIWNKDTVVVPSLFVKFLYIRLNLKCSNYRLKIYRILYSPTSRGSKRFQVAKFRLVLQLL